MNETKKEPTTAELFATTRDGIHGRILDITADEAVSELERRMGAQERVLEALLASGIDAQWMEDGKRVGLCSMARAALTDAPPVFTLEEVDAAVLTAWREAGSSLSVEELTLRVCAALRR